MAGLAELSSLIQTADSSGVAVMVIDREDRIVFANDANRRLFRHFRFDGLKPFEAFVREGLATGAVTDPDIRSHPDRWIQANRSLRQQTPFFQIVRRNPDRRPMLIEHRHLPGNLQCQLRLPDPPSTVALGGILAPAAALQSAAVSESEVTATALVGVDCRPIAMNRAMEAILRDADGLALQGGRLVATSSRENSTLRSKISRYARSLPPEPAYLRISRTASAHPLLVRLAALPGASLCLPGFDEAPEQEAVRVSVLDPVRPLSVPEQVLSDMYGVTTAEARVAIGLVRGLRLSDIADERQVSLGTVRNQVKSAFAKMGISHQADLVRVLAGIATITCDDGI